MSAAPTFVAEEVWRLAQFVRERGTELDGCGRNAFWYCNCCDARVNAYRTTDADIPHEADCLYVIAGDVLVGAPASVTPA